MFYLKLPNRKIWYPVNAAEILSLSHAVEPVARESAGAARSQVCTTR
jgi:hypothetical protein